MLFSAKPNELSLISGRRDGFERRDSIDMPSLDEEEGDDTDRKVSSFYLFNKLFRMICNAITFLDRKPCF
jgi:hypothetical protein